jgi:hypothetical protein
MRNTHSGLPARMRVATYSAVSLLAAAGIAMSHTTAHAAHVHAATPAGVTVRVEGLKGTLVPPITVKLNTTAITDDGHAADSCPGLSALAALDDATQGAWSGTWSASYKDYLITGIEGVNYPSTASYYWAFWINNKPAAQGACAINPKPGSSILFFPEYDGKNKSIVAPSVLGVDAPAIAVIGKPFTVSVASYANTNGKRSSASGATVLAAGKSVTTSPTGKATLDLAKAGNVTLKVSAANSVRTEATVCVQAAGAHTCGMAK